MERCFVSPDRFSRLCFETTRTKGTEFSVILPVAEVPAEITARKAD